MDEHKQESAAVKAARERYEALKAQSYAPDAERVALGAYVAKEQKERERLEKEGREALALEASILESEAWAALSPDQRAKASIVCAYDYPTHRRTGRGVMVVTSIGREAAVAALKNSNKASSNGVDLYDGSEAAVLRDLLDASLYPNSSDVQAICMESPIFASSVHAQVMSLSGLATRVTAGKSGS